MANNISKTPAETVTFIAPAGGVISGQAVLIGSLLLVALNAAAAGAQCEGLRSGIVTLVKDTGAGTGWAAGGKVYWNAATSKVTGVLTGNTLIGCGDPEVATVAVGDVSGSVLLNGTVV